MKRLDPEGTPQRALVAAVAQVPALIVLVYLVMQFMGYVGDQAAAQREVISRNVMAMSDLRSAVDSLADAMDRLEGSHR